MRLVKCTSISKGEQIGGQLSNSRLKTDVLSLLIPISYSFWTPAPGRARPGLHDVRWAPVGHLRQEAPHRPPHPRLHPPQSRLPRQHNMVHRTQGTTSVVV